MIIGEFAIWALSLDAAPSRIIADLANKSNSRQESLGRDNGSCQDNFAKWCIQVVWYLP